MRVLCLIGMLVSACTFSPATARPDAATPAPGAPDASPPSPTTDGPPSPPSTCLARATMTYGGHHYFLTTDEDWPTASSDCAGVGGHLVKIESAAENGFLIGLFAPGYAWIGLSRPDGAHPFVWTDGTVPAFSSFTRAPDDQDADCVNESATGSWIPYDCGTPQAAICECE